MTVHQSKDNRKPKITGKQIALLHVARRDLGLSEDEYRAIISGYGGVESSSDLDQLGFGKVMKYFNALGFRSTWQKRTFGYRSGMASPAQVELMRKLWSSYYKGDGDAETALNDWLIKFHKISALRFVDSKKVSNIISALKAMAARQ